MSFLNGTAATIMLKAAFPSIFAKVEQLEQDGTIDKFNDLLVTLSTNGTFDALKSLAVKLDRHNDLLDEIANHFRLHGVGALSGPDTGNAGNGLSQPAGLSGDSGTD